MENKKRLDVEEKGKTLSIIMSFLLVIALFIGAIYDSKHQPPPETKKIIKKETSLSGVPFVPGSTSTNFYLVAGDGSYLKVDIGQWSNANIGDYFTSYFWEK